MQKGNLTHSNSHPNEEVVSSYKDRIRKQGDLPYASTSYQLEILEDMSSSELGLFILKNKGTDGFWTNHLLSHKTGSKNLSFFEDFLLNKCPVVLAHRERFQIFKNTLQSLLKCGATIASIPCGLMKDLLELDYTGINACKLVGIDIDENSLKHAKKAAKKLNNKQIIELVQKDAWLLESSAEFDVITSSGLNVYQPSREKTVSLYKILYNALKENGVLVTSVLTYPPFLKESTDWDMSLITKEDLILDRIIHHDILGVNWRNFRHIDEIPEDFYKAGFSKVEIKLDSRRIFPTVIAHKDCR